VVQESSTARDHGRIGIGLPSIGQTPAAGQTGLMALSKPL